MQRNSFDIIIVGGGLVGASLAIMLRDSDYRIAIVEAFAHDADAQPCYDDRTVALSYGSRTILQNMGLWPALHDQVEAIKTIHISDRGHLGVTRLYHDEEGVEALGYVAENRVLGEVLHAQLARQDNVTLFCPATLQSIEEYQQQVSVVVEQDGEPVALQAKCLVAADGIHSKVRRCLSIANTGKTYHQCAVIANITPGQRHDNIAYERFTDTGPVALLPMTGNRYSVVWTQPVAQAEQTMRLDDEAFLQQLQQRFGYRAGILKKTGMRSMYPLSLQASSELVRGRVVMVGNAAHAIHPVAGQGFNLALRDIATLVDCFTAEHDRQLDPGRTELLLEYQSIREADTRTVYRFTDALIKIFSNDFSPLAHSRSVGLLAVDVLPFIKHRLAKQSMGLAGRLPGLSRV